MLNKNLCQAFVLNDGKIKFLPVDIDRFSPELIGHGHREAVMKLLLYAERRVHAARIEIEMFEQIVVACQEWVSMKETDDAR